VKRRELLLAALTLLPVTVGGCAKEQVEAIPTIEVEVSETFVRIVKAEGTLQAVQATPILPPADTQRPMKIAWIADDGTRVDEGEVVVRFDATDLERELLDSQDDVRSTQQQMAKVGVERAAGMDNRDATERLAEFEAKVAREFEHDDVEIFSRAEIVESEIDVDVAEAKAKHARTVKGIEGSVSQNQLALHQIAKQQAKRSVERAEEGLANLELQAPHPGVFVLERGWGGKTVKVGDTVWPRQKLAELPLVAELEAKLFVLEADAGSLAEGIEAEVFVDSNPALAHPGAIKQVDTLAQPRHPEVPVNYFGVTVKLEKTDTESMRVGQRVRANLRIEADDAIVVPRQSVFERDGRMVVYRKSGDGFEAREVELGAASAGRVVIESGLVAGDEIALRDPMVDASKLLSDADAPAADAKGGGGGGMP
jgi:multidrug resistance efflux pump